MKIEAIQPGFYTVSIVEQTVGLPQAVSGGSLKVRFYQAGDSEREGQRPEEMFS